MPAVRLDRPPVAPREYIPWLWIYTPLFFKWMWLSLRYRSLTLPTVANPNIETGGLRGELKTSYLRQIGAAEQRWVAVSALLRFPEGAHPWPPLRIAEAKMAEAGLDYPLIAKPDIGSCGYGVRLIRDRADFADYLARFPRDQQLMLQQYLPWAGEAGVFYVRRPGETRDGSCRWACATTRMSSAMAVYPFVASSKAMPGRLEMQSCIARRTKLGWTKCRPWGRSCA